MAKKELNNSVKEKNKNKWLAWINNENLLSAAIFLCLTIIMFHFLFTGKTIGTMGQQMCAEYPWRDMIPNDFKVKTGYPQTDVGDGYYHGWVNFTTSIQSGTFPLWFPWDFAGTRMIETGLTSYYYPIRLILAFIFNPIIQHNIILFLHIIIALFAMYKFLRYIGGNFSGAILGAIVWAVNGHIIYYMSMHFVLIYAALLPIILLAIAKSIKEISVLWALIAGLFMGLIVFAGYANYSYVTFGIIIIFYIYYYIKSFQIAITDIRQKKQFFYLPVVSLIAALVVGAGYWMPFLDVFRDTVRQPMSLENHIKESISLKEAIRGIIYPHSLNGPVWFPLDRGSLLFVGPITLILAIISLFNKSKTIIFVSILTLISFLFVVGWTPIYIIGHKLIPFFGTIHPFSIGAYIFTFGIAILSAFGMVIISKTKLNPNIIYIFQGAAILLVSLGFVMLVWNSQPIQPINDKYLFPETPLVNELTRMQTENHSRLITVYKNQGTWSPPIFFGRSWGVFGLRSLTGYDSLLTTSQYNMISVVVDGSKNISHNQVINGAIIKTLANDKIPVKLLNLMSVKYIVSPPGVELYEMGKKINNEDINIEYKGNDGVIWSLNNSLPRAFLVNNIVTTIDDQASLELILSPDFNYKDTVITSSPVDQSVLSYGNKRDLTSNVKFLEDGINNLKIEVNTSSPGLLVINDSWAPGWRALVNDIPTDIYRTNIFFRGLIVPPGKSIVELTYRPYPFIIGLYLTYSSIFVISIIIMILWVKTKSLISK